MKSVLLVLLLSSPAFGAGGKDVQARMEKDAEAWDGREIEKATVRFLELAAGHEGKAHAVAYVGHDGLMDFKLKETPKAVARAYRKYQKCSIKAARGLFAGDTSGTGTGSGSNLP